MEFQSRLYHTLVQEKQPITQQQVMNQYGISSEEAQILMKSTYQQHFNSLSALFIISYINPQNSDNLILRSLIDFELQGFFEKHQQYIQDLKLYSLYPIELGIYSVGDIEKLNFNRESVLSQQSDVAQIEQELNTQLKDVLQVISKDVYSKQKEQVNSKKQINIQNGNIQETLTAVNERKIEEEHQKHIQENSQSDGEEYYRPSVVVKSNNIISQPIIQTKIVEEKPQIQQNSIVSSVVSSQAVVSSQLSKVNKKPIDIKKKQDDKQQPNLMSFFKSVKQ